MKAPPIFAPTFHGDVARVRALLDAEPSLIAARNAKNLTPLHVAASRGRAVVIGVLLDYGADVHGPSENDEWTPIVYAAYRGHFDAVKILVENGAGITEAGGNPIHFAGQRGHKEICRFLVERGAVDDLVARKDADLLRLFRASYGYDSEAAEEVLEARPELVHGTDRNGRTALHEACTNGDIRTVRVLLKYGADVAIRDDAGETPVDRASAHRQRAVLKLLE